MIINKIFYVLLLVGLFLLQPPTIQAQTPEFVTINHVVSEEQNDSVRLSVFFNITDGEGHPIFQPNLDSATIQLLGANREPVPATIEDPQTPVFIALLLDTSGSMQNVIGDVRTAAVSAIDTASPTSHFAVITFNETSILLQDFTNDHNRVKNVINRIEATPDSGTCLYDSLYDAIGQLDQQIQDPQTRRAIILFTDGRDQLRVDSNEPCSLQTYDGVITAARPTSLATPLTPIHTIGLYDQQRANLNEPELRRMAEETRAFSAIGNPTDLGQLFQQIIDGLNSQLVAHANVFANEGNNQAVLTTNMPNIVPPPATTFNFFASRNYNLPPPPVNIQISSLQYDEAQDAYLLSLSNTNPQGIRKIIINVWDVRRGTQVTNDQFFENPGPTLLAELDASTLEESREYSIHVQAENQDAFLIRNEDGETLLAQTEVVYEPPQAAPIEFSIQSVNANYESQLLIIDLDVPDTGRVQTYEGFVLDNNTGGKIYEFGPIPFSDRKIQQPLPPEIQLAETQGEYLVTVYLTTAGQQRSAATFEDFSPPLPPTKPLIVRISDALLNNPIILGFIILIISCIVGWVVLNKRKNKKKVEALPRPPIDQTRVYDHASSRPAIPSILHDLGYEDDIEDIVPASSNSAQVHLRIIKTPMPPPNTQQTITHFPFLIGREGCNLNIIGDQRISRQHLKIFQQGNQLFITDLGSRNGTFVNDQKLQPQSPTPLEGTITVHLSSQTHLELKARL